MCFHLFQAEVRYAILMNNLKTFKSSPATTLTSLKSIVFCFLTNELLYFTYSFFVMGLVVLLVAQVACLWQLWVFRVFSPLFIVVSNTNLFKKP